MSRLWGWWRRPNGTPTVTSLRRSLAELGDRLHELNRERNRLAGQLVSVQIARDQAQYELQRVRRIVSDTGLTESQVVQALRAELGEGESRG